MIEPDSKPLSNDVRRFDPESRHNIILTGFMGTGKTTVGRLLARKLGRKFFDTDRLIEERLRQSIAEIFQHHGETFFRSLEKELCREISQETGAVVATGGGMLLDRENRRLLSRFGIVFRLKCAPEVVLGRIGSARTRPKLAGDPPSQVKKLWAEREPLYTSLPFQVETTGLSEEQVLENNVRVSKIVGDRLRTLPVSLPRGEGYSISIGDGVLELIGTLLQNRGFTSRIAVVTDENVEKLYMETATESLRSAGFEPFPCVIPAGEQSKAHDHLMRLYERFLEIGIDRKGVVVALGGGVTGDLAGFAAATYMRGVALAHCPTTLLAMVDSSIGGKTGVDLPRGKNLVGAFKQPVCVLSDTQTLKSLPEREIRMGTAEVIKHAVIDDPELFTSMEDRKGCLELDPALIERSAAVKVRVVETDLFESGLREVLNLGHTVGHALEQVSGYRIGHGDAVAVGLVAAARMSVKMGLCADELSDRVESLLLHTGFPVRHNAAPEAIMQAMTADKKTLEGRVRFVLIRDIGSVEPGRHVPPDVVREVLNALRQCSAHI
jgi:shikimate kinase / 3-dehydroquinate synthase